MEKSFIKPAEQRVVVLPEKRGETKTMSGIIIPGTVTENMPEIAKVVAVGSGSKDSPMLYSIGQRVLYSQYAGLELKLNLEWADGEKTYRVMNQLDIMGVISKAN